MNHDDLTSTLTRELEDRAHTMDGSTLHLADVRGRARSIRRRRTATAVVGAVAAVGLIVPTAVLATHSNGRPEPAPASQSPSPSSPSSTTTTGQQPPPGVLDGSDLPTGAVPATDYVYDGRLHLRDGGTGPVDTRYAPDQFVEMQDGSRVWHTVHDGTPFIEIQDSDGSFHDPVRSGWGVGVNARHSIAAWLSPSGQVTVFGGGASEPRPLGDPVPGSDLRVGPVTGDDCSLACTVVVNARNGAGQPWEVSDSGSQPMRDGGLLAVQDVSEAGLTVGYTTITDSGSCSTLLGGGELQGFSTCSNTLTAFSPDGQLILGLPAYLDGAGPNEIAMYDLSGHRLFDRRATAKAQSTYLGQAWEDDTHVLISVHQAGKWSLVRVGSDGSMEYAVAPRPGVDVTRNPYLLPTGGGLPGA